MNRLTILACAGATFALGSSPAFAQTYMSASPAQASPAPSYGNSQQRVPVTLDTTTGGFRIPTWGDNSMAAPTLDQFVAHYRQNQVGGATMSDAQRDALAREDFNRIAASVPDGCSSIGEWIRESFAIAAEVHANQLDVEANGAQVLPLLNELDSARRIQRGANTIDMIATVASSAALCLVPGAGWAYCAAAGAAGLGRLGQLYANGQNQRVDYGTRVLDLRMRNTHTNMASTSNRMGLLHIRQNVGWARRFHAYCMIVAPNETSGLGSVPTDDSVLRWNYGRSNTRTDIRVLDRGR